MERSRPRNRKKITAAVLLALLLGVCAREAIDMPIWLRGAGGAGGRGAQAPTAGPASPGQAAPITPQRPRGDAQLVRTAPGTSAALAGRPAAAGPSAGTSTTSSATPADSANAYELVPFDLFVNGASAGSVMARVTPAGVVLVGLQDVRRVTGAHLAGAPAWITTTAIGVELGATVDVDLPRLAIRITRAAAFPAETLRRTAARRAAYPVATTAAARPVNAGLVTGGALLEWDASLPGTDAERGTVRARLSGLVAGGLASVTYGRAPLAQGGRSSYGAHWVRRFSLPWLSELEAGNLAGVSTVQSLPLFGIRATNVPHLRAGMMVPLGADVPAGWSYDVLAAGRYVGGGDGGRPVAVLLPYGLNAVEVRAYGPGGESVVRRLALVLQPGQLPARAVEYSAAAGRCSLPGCDELGASAEAAWGAADWLTLGGAAAWSGEDGTALGGSASLATMAGLQLRAEGTTHGALRIAGIRTGTASGAAAALGRRSARSPWYGELSSRLATRTRTSWVPSSLGFSAYAHAGGRSAAYGRGASGRATVFAAWHRAHGEASYAWLPSGFGHETHARATWLLPARLPAFLADQPISADVRRDGAGVVDLGASVQLRIRDRDVLNLGPRWDRYNGWGLALMLASYGMPTELRTQLRTGRHGTESWTSAAGAFAYAPGSGGVLQVRPGSSYTGGVAGRVFYDLDGNGVFSPGDSAATGVRVLVGVTGDDTDASGVYAAWDLRPYDLVAVRIDSTAIRDPRWVALRPEISVMPLPSIFQTADFPLQQTVEVAGALVAGELVGTAAGVGITIRNVDTGETRQVKTFTDGTYYVARLAPGRYELSVDRVALELLVATADPAPLTFTTLADGPGILELPTVRLERLRGP